MVNYSKVRDNILGLIARTGDCTIQVPDYSGLGPFYSEEITTASGSYLSFAFTANTGDTIYCEPANGKGAGVLVKDSEIFPVVGDDKIYTCSLKVTNVDNDRYQLKLTNGAFTYGSFDPDTIEGSFDLTNNNKTLVNTTALSYIYSDVGLSAGSGAYYFEWEGDGSSSQFGISQQPPGTGLPYMASWTSVVVSDTGMVRKVGPSALFTLSAYGAGVRTGLGVDFNTAEAQFFTNGVPDGPTVAVDTSSQTYILSWFSVVSGTCTIYTDPIEMNYAPEGYTLGWGSYI